jgi:hypothetical protein
VQIKLVALVSLLLALSTVAAEARHRGETCWRANRHTGRILLRLIFTQHAQRSRNRPRCGHFSFVRKLRRMASAGSSQKGEDPTIQDRQDNADAALPDDSTVARSRRATTKPSGQRKCRKSSMPRCDLVDLHGV